MTELRKDLPPLPRRMTGMPVDERGYPVPWFVHWIDGKPDFRVIRPSGFAEAVNKSKCWLCGDTMGRYSAFVVGPMGVINRISAEPPAHRDCAEFAVRACPFMVHPTAKYREAGVPAATRAPAGDWVARNPGVFALWVTRSWRPFEVRNGYLIDMGLPIECGWWREGRAATRDEVRESIGTGLAALTDIAEQKEPDSVGTLNWQAAEALRLLPAA